MIIEQNIEQHIEHTLNALVEGSDLIGTKEEAKVFLRAVADGCPQNTWKVVLPVTRQLLCYDGWQQHLTIDAIYDYCLPRVWVTEMLRAIPRTDAFDPEVDFMVGMVSAIQDRLMNQANESQSA